MTRLTRLRLEARTACTLRGHTMGGFEQSNWYIDKRYAHCVRCNMQVVINAKPAANEINIGGEAVALDCTVGDQL